MPAPLLPLADAEEYAGPDYSGLWLDSIMQLAANAVVGVAPRPDPMPDDYLKSARAAELLVGAYLWENRGRYTSLSGEDGSLSYTAWNTVLDTISQTMPAEYMGYNTAYISRGHA